MNTTTIFALLPQDIKGVVIDKLVDNTENFKNVMEEILLHQEVHLEIAKILDRYDKSPLVNMDMWRNIKFNDMGKLMSITEQSCLWPDRIRLGLENHRGLLKYNPCLNFKDAQGNKL
tara:strand:- start:162 stop:512 length:351 start_codon:yes stop_codon:yes gene_type:complete